MQQALVRTTARLEHGDATEDTGLNQLQIWSAESGGLVYLFEVTNRASAENWLKAQAAFGHVQSQEYLTTA